MARLKFGVTCLPQSSCVMSFLFFWMLNFESLCASVALSWCVSDVHPIGVLVYTMISTRNLYNLLYRGSIVWFQNDYLIFFLSCHFKIMPFTLSSHAVAFSAYLFIHANCEGKPVRFWVSNVNNIMWIFFYCEAMFFILFSVQVILLCWVFIWFVSCVLNQGH